MISDVLFEAVEQIEEYQKAMPQCYDSIKDRIDKVKGEMKELQIFLDTPPSLDEFKEGKR